MPDLMVDVRAGAWWVTLNRPKALNAITTSLKQELLEVFEAAEADPEAVCFVLTGAGRAFCAGADIHELAAAGREEGLLASISRVETTQRLVERFGGSRLVTIAAVNGLAAGGGVSLALACDLILVDPGARFSLLFGKRGLVPDGALTRHLVERVGRRRATALALTCSDVTAEDALRLGMADEVVSPGNLDVRVAEQVAEFAARGTMTAALTKRAFVERGHADLALEAITQAISLQHSTLGTRKV